MADFAVESCFGCGAKVDPGPGVYYCSECVAKQLVDEESEREAFNAFHAYADLVARR